MKTGRRSMPTDAKKRPVIYWDTCVFLAWMQNEKRAAGEMEGLDEVSSLVKKDKVVLVTSTLTRAEVLKGKVSKEAMEKYSKLFRRSNVVPLILDTPVSVLTSDIRDFYNPTDFELLTPDAIHLATAIHHKVTEFHTFDGCNPKRKPRKPDKQRCGLLLLDGNVAGHVLKIRKPNAEQLGLLTSIVESIPIGENDKTQGTVGGETGQAPTESSSSGIRGGGSGSTEDQTGTEEPEDLKANGQERSEAKERTPKVEGTPGAAPAATPAPTDHNVSANATTNEEAKQ